MGSPGSRGSDGRVCDLEEFRKHVLDKVASPRDVAEAVPDVGQIEDHDEDDGQDLCRGNEGDCQAGIYE